MDEEAMDEQGGSLHIIIQTLDPDDGNPETGDDEGAIAFWSRVKEGTPAGTIIQNCATATPEYGTGGQGCAQVIIPDLTISKAQDANDRINSTQITEVFPKDVIRYRVTATNSLEHAVFLKVHDELDAPVEYIPGTFMVNGAQASDSFISQGVLDYPSLSWQNAGGNPGGFLQGNDLTRGIAWYFVSPVSWEGNWSQYIKGI